MTASDLYTITLRGTSFHLDRSQLEFDSPNYFTACFLGSFSESNGREIRLSRDPSLFSLIVNYLSGYTIFPLREVDGMAPEGVLENLLADALFYGLEDLVDILQEHKAGVRSLKRLEESTVKTWLMVYWPQGLGSRKPPLTIRISESQAHNQCSTHPIPPGAVMILHSPGTALMNKLLRDQKVQARGWTWSAFWTVFRAGGREVECDCAVVEIEEVKRD
ncbi:hypothetical protein FRC08_004438 [Ceratobasidium sp. 394]|nr:hypothetical protein FRC08_004438 [Ceratobasidium sp. 394]